MCKITQFTVLFLCIRFADYMIPKFDLNDLTVEQKMLLPKQILAHELFTK